MKRCANEIAAALTLALFGAGCDKTTEVKPAPERASATAAATATAAVSAAALPAGSARPKGSAGSCAPGRCGEGSCGGKK